jgi:antitoxin component YwqK of YwqJK toxin-antitoxin module
MGFGKNSLEFLLAVLFNCLLMGCHGKERSEIEIIKYDPNLVKEIISHFDSTYTEYPKRHDFWSIDHYLTNSNRENLILRDSLKNIVGIIEREKGKNFFSQEYYLNGQAKGKIEYHSDKISGPAIYYFQDGRIRSTGQWNDVRQVGEWKNYDERGYLVSVQYYSLDGQLEKETKQQQ